MNKADSLTLKGKWMVTYKNMEQYGTTKVHIWKTPVEPQYTSIHLKNMKNMQNFQNFKKSSKYIYTTLNILIYIKLETIQKRNVKWQVMFLRKEMILSNNTEFQMRL